MLSRAKHGMIILVFLLLVYLSRVDFLTTVIEYASSILVRKHTQNYMRRGVKIQSERTRRVVARSISQVLRQCSSSASSISTVRASSGLRCTSNAKSTGKIDHPDILNNPQCSALLPKPPRNNTTVSSGPELRIKAADGGCQESCSARLGCGHACLRRCHPDDSEHGAS